MHLMTRPSGSHRPCWLGPARLVKNVPPGTAHPHCWFRRRRHGESRALRRPDPRPLTSVEAIDHGEHVFSIADRPVITGPVNASTSHRTPLMRFFVPFSACQPRREQRLRATNPKTIALRNQSGIARPGGLAGWVVRSVCPPHACGVVSYGLHVTRDPQSSIGHVGQAR